MALTAGTRLGPYEIVSALGAGGMGEVYRAHDPRLGRDVAIKILPTAFSADPDRLRRFEQEARAAAALNHPNILAVYDIGTHNGAPYVVSELLEGETLRARLGPLAGATSESALAAGAGASGGDGARQAGMKDAVAGLPVRKALDYAIQIAHGLAAAHEKGIVHRDLKPENLFITTDGRAKILDFGLAKLTQAEPAVAASQLPTIPAFDHVQAGLATEPGMALGTIGYMAPEQVRGLVADYRADIFAFGAVLYEMLSGQRAFRGDTAADTMTAILKEDPPDLPAEARHIPPALERMVDRCLEKNPGSRFQSTSDLSFAMESLSSVSRSTETAVSGVVAPAGTRRAPLLRIATAAAFVLLPVLTFLVGMRMRAEPPQDGPPVRFLFQPSETRLGPVGFGAPVVSPDGRWLVFAGISSRGLSLWVRDNRSAAVRELPGTWEARAPFWSPDSRYVAFVADGKIKRIEIGGTASETVCQVPGGVSNADGSWGADGTMVFGGRTLRGIFRVPASGGTPSPLTNRDEANKDLEHRFPSFLPDGRRFLFSIRSVNPDRTGLYVGSLEGTQPVRLLGIDAGARYVPPGYLLFVRQQRVLAQVFNPQTVAVTGDLVPLLDNAGPGTRASWEISASDNGVLVYAPGGQVDSQLTWIERSGRVAGSLAEPGNYPTFDLSKDAGRVVLSRLQPDGWSNLWLADLVRGSMSRLTLEEANHVDPRWSPDGRQVIFGSSRDLARSPFQVSLANQNPVQIMKFTGATFSLDDWSPDGRYLVYHDASRPELWALPLDGDRKPMLVTRSLSGVMDQAQFSPDGRWIAYNTNESGRYEVKVVPFPPTGDKWQISTAGGAQPTWRGDGRELYFLAPDSTLMAVDVRPGARFEWGSARPLFKTQLAPLSSFTEQYAPAPDGQRFLFMKPIEGAPPPSATIVMNWPALLKR